MFCGSVHGSYPLPSIYFLERLLLFCLGLTSFLQGLHLRKTPPPATKTKTNVKENPQPQAQIPTKANDSVQASFLDLIDRLFNFRTICSQRTMPTILIKLPEKEEIP